MGNWEKKTVLIKRKMFPISTGIQFKLSDLTDGLAWGDHVVRAGITNMEHGYDTFSTECEVVRTGHDTYYTRIWRQGVISEGIVRNYSIPYTGFGAIHTIVNEVNFGGISIYIAVHDCIPPLQVLVLVNDEYWLLNQVFNNTSFSISNTLKVPATDYVTGNVKVQLIPQTGQIYTTTRADISFNKFVKTRNEIAGTTNVLAYEV